MLDITNDKIIQKGFNILDDKTQKAYYADIKTWYEFSKKDFYKADIQDILNYIKFLEIDKQYKYTTINRKLNSLSKFISLYHAANIINNNCVKDYKLFSTVKRSYMSSVRVNFTLSDIKKVVRKENKYTVIIMFLVNSGCRISECINIKNSDIKSYSKTHKKILITGKRKTQRTIFLKISLLNKIKKYYPTQYNCSLFYTKNFNKYDRSNLSKKISSIFENEKDIHVTPHQLRHFFATYKIHNQKQDLKKVANYLGHASTSTTADMYLDTALEPGEESII